MPKPPADAGAVPTLRAGTSRVDVTTDRAEYGVNDPLLTKCLVLTNETTSVVIIAMDALAIGGIGDISNTFLSQLRQRITAELGIPGEHVLVNASHTHPLGRLICDGEDLLERVFSAVREASADLAPVLVGSGSGFEDRITVNRDLEVTHDRHWTIRYAHPGPPEDTIESVGVIDPEIGLLRFDRLDGTPLAVIYNFAGHPLLGVPSRAVTANYPGFASRTIEDSLGHGVTALFLQGAGGNIIEAAFKDPHLPRDSEPVGERLGLSTLRALREVTCQPTTALGVAHSWLELPRKTDARTRIDDLEKRIGDLVNSLEFTPLNFESFLPVHLQRSLNPRYPSDHAFKHLQDATLERPVLEGITEHNRALAAGYLRNIRATEEIVRLRADVETLKLHVTDPDTPAQISSEVQLISIGDTVIMACAAEMLVEVGLRLKSASPFARTIVAAYSNGYDWYGPPDENYPKGGYEVVECRLGPGWSDTYEQRAMELARELRHRGAGQP